jgi:hypothetical protein
MEPLSIALLAGSVLGLGSSIWGQQKANKQARAEAQKNRDFQAQQSSTAYQRQVADMKAAGINPISAYGSGGASSGSGSMAQIENILADAPEVTSSTAKMFALERERLKADIAKVKEDIKTAKKTQNLLDVQYNKTGYESQQEGLAAQSAFRFDQLEKIKHKKRIKEAQVEDKASDVLKYVDPILRRFSPLGAAKDLKFLFQTKEKKGGK